MALSLTNAEVVQCLPILADYVEKADGGSTTTVYAKSLKGLDEDEVEGAYICFLNGDNRGVDRIITDYTSTDVGTFTFDALDSPVDNTVMVAIVYQSFQPCVIGASGIIENDFRNRGLDLDLFKDPTQLKFLHRYRTLANVCRIKRQDADAEDIYHINYQEFLEQYERELVSLKADYDANESGDISESEEEYSVGQTRFVR